MPVYNEARPLSEVWGPDEAVAVALTVRRAAEIVLVDDASTDESLDILRDLRRRQIPAVVRVLRHEANHGIMVCLRHPLH